MLGLIKKDILLIKKDIPQFIVMTALFALVFRSLIFLSVLVPLILMMIAIGTIQSDKASNFYPFAISLPNGRRNLVLSKYCLVFVILLITMVLEVIIGLAMGENIIELIGLSTTIVIVYSSILIPVYFIFSSQTASAALFIVLFGGSFLVKNLVKLFGFSSASAILEKSSLLKIFIPIALLILFLFSITISLKFVKYEDF